MSGPSDLANRRITVAGLGRFGGGIEVARWLVQQGDRVLVTDKEPAEKLADSVAKLSGLPIEFRLGEHREEDFTTCDLVVTSPAIPLDNPYLVAAKNAGVPITTEIRLFIERCSATVAAVTGTKGKSTTTTLLGMMLKSKFTTWVGGNIGGSLLAKLPEIQPGHLVVLELSSYMLEHLGVIRFAPHVAVVTMLTQDHLAWHGTFENYLNSKKNIVRFQKPDDVAVLSELSDERFAFERETAARIVHYGLENRKPFTMKLAGRHNQLNAQAAYAAADVFGINWDDAQDAIREFGGLSHRLQLVHEYGEVRWYNDSIATIPEAAVAALGAFAHKSVIQIVGGYDKHLPMTDLCAALAHDAKAVLCIGDLGPSLARTLGESPITGAAGVYDCGDLATAVKIAKQIAVSGDVVLLSPGCASYDQFTNFEARGDAFTKLARS